MGNGYRHLEGHLVAVMLVDGSHLDNVELVSAGRGRVNSLWLDRDGSDFIVRKDQVVELREMFRSAA